MLLNLNKHNWANSLKMDEYTSQHKTNVEAIKNLSKLAEKYNKWIQEETKKTTSEFVVSSVGKMNPKSHLA